MGSGTGRRIRVEHLMGTVVSIDLRDPEVIERALRDVDAVRADLAVVGHEHHGNSELGTDRS